jgi:hypothetical protein
MTNDQIEFTFRVDAGEAAALLKFLRRVPFHDIKRALDWAVEVRAFEGGIRETPR